jgi:hypothetical protein
VEQEEKVEEVVSTPVAEEILDVTVSEIVNGSKCFLHVTSDNALAMINEKMKAFTAAVSGTPPHGHNNRLTYRHHPGAA